MTDAQPPTSKVWLAVLAVASCFLLLGLGFVGLSLYAFYRVDTATSETRARSVLYLLADHQEVFRARDEEHDGRWDYATFEEMVTAQQAIPGLHNRSFGYRYRVHLSEDRMRWVGVATPLDSEFPTYYASAQGAVFWTAEPVEITSSCMIPHAAKLYRERSD